MRPYVRASLCAKDVQVDRTGQEETSRHTDLSRRTGTVSSLNSQFDDATNNASATTIMYENIHCKISDTRAKCWPISNANCISAFRANFVGKGYS